MGSQSTQGTPPRVALVTNILAPYRVPLFNRLAEMLAGNLIVFFSSLSYRDRDWQVPTDVAFDYKVIGGFTLKGKGRGRYESRRTYIGPVLLTKLIHLRPDVVIAAESSVPSLLIIIYCTLFRKLYISWSENTLYQEGNASRLQRFVRRWMIRRAHAGIGASSAAMEKYRHYGMAPERVFLGIQTVDVTTIMSQAAQMRQTNPALEAPKEPAIIYVGSLSDRKGVPHLLEAFALVVRKTPCRLILVGSGPLEEALRSRVAELNLQEKVEFAGFLEGTALVEAYVGASLFVFPTLEDTFGVVVNEAMACGLPVISSPFAGASADLVMDGENGYVVDPHNKEILAGRIVEILADEQRRKKMGTASLSIIARYDIEASVKGFLEAIHYARS